MFTSESLNVLHVVSSSPESLAVDIMTALKKKEEEARAKAYTEQCETVWYFVVHQIILNGSRDALVIFAPEVCRKC